MARGALDAAARLAEYQRELDRVVTRHLREYLALTTLGIPVDFRPESPGDIEFGGLTGLRAGDARIAEMRDGIRDLLAGVFETILAGTDEAGVYERWRELTRDRVAAARARFEAPAVDVPTTIDVPAAVEASMAGSQRFGPHEAVDRAVVADIVLAFDQNLLDPAAVLIESLVEHASGPLRLWVLGRGLPDAYPAWLAGAFPALPITVIPCDRITFGANGRPARIPPRITISTMDRLLVPEMLTDIDRVVYLDIDTIVFDDVRRLATMDLGGHPVAARHSTVSEASEWQRAGRRLSADTATELRRVMARRHALRPSRAECGRAGLRPRPDAPGRFLADGPRLGRAVRPQRPGQRPRLRRTGTRGDRVALERAAVPRGRRRPVAHPLGQPGQALGVPADLRAGPLARVCRAAPRPRRQAAGELIAT